VLQATWLIARRAAVESLRDRTTLWLSLFFALVVPVGIVFLLIEPQSIDVVSAKGLQSLGRLMAIYFLITGLGPSSGAISIASGVFAGEKEKGNLAPLLATPASNTAIFAGKALGAVLPALLYAALAEVTYVTTLLLVVGIDRLSRLPLDLSLCMLLSVPAVSVFGAAVASLISSRARTYNGAQMATSLAVLPIMGGLFGLAYQMQSWAPAPLFGMLGALVILDIVVIRLSAATWRREEVLAHL
jgi:ABC-type Na+ efflux pump permease subunit